MVCDAAARVPQSLTECAIEKNNSEYRLLLVDDEPSVLATIAVFLAKAGFTVEKTDNGDDALRKIADDPAIGILVTDFAMLEMSGVELISQATQIRPNLKALMMTGYPNSDGLPGLPPDTQILVKPFRRVELIAGVKSLLAGMEAMPN
jgi:DNA-binding NtrC family response regulator